MKPFSTEVVYNVDADNPQVRREQALEDADVPQL